MRSQHAITIRLYPEQARALAALAEREDKRPSQLLREAVDLRLRVENQSLLLADEVRRASGEVLTKLHQEVRLLIKEQISASMASDQTSRELISAFLEAISAKASPTTGALPVNPGSKKDGMLPPRSEV